MVNRRGTRRAPPRAAKQRAAAAATGPSHHSPRHDRVTRSTTRLHPGSGSGDRDQLEDSGAAEVPRSLGRKRGAQHLDVPHHESASSSKRARLVGPAEASAHSPHEVHDESESEESDVVPTSRGRRQNFRHEAEDDVAYLSPATDEDILSSNAAPRHTRPSTARQLEISLRAHARRPQRRASLVDHAAVHQQPAMEQGEGSLPWSGLPYMILLDIFEFAATPLDNRGSVRWLVAASTTCRSFAEPALTALYRCPPLLTMAMAHNLAELLAKPPSETWLNYRQKIEALHIDVGLLATLTYKGRYLDIEGMIKHCPRLRDLDFFHQKDQSPYRELSDRIRWAYPADLFKVLSAEPVEGSAASSQCEEQRSPTRLRSWRWSARMMAPELTLRDMTSVHSSLSFASLTKITLVNYQRPSLKVKNASEMECIAMDKNHAETFAEMLKALPSLTHLVFESSTALNEHLLPLLPTTLRHLELINCWDVFADPFASYLSTHGHELRHLTLHHNQSLSLAFLPLLGDCCPKLKSLRMNLTYYKLHEFYVDSKPNYDDLLSADQVPTWPSGIQVVELENLRKWSSETAEMFFQSFVDSAPEMPSLRRLSIKAMLDIPWRQRCAIRDRWEGKLMKCFLRRRSSPSSWKSIADVPQQRLVEAALRREMRQRKRKLRLRLAAENGEMARRSKRITHSSSSSSRASSIARELRRGGHGPVSYREPDSDEDLEDLDGLEDAGTFSDNEDELASTSGDGNEPSQSEEARPFVHGLCDVVDVRFDNQKPMERQFGMDDFLDSEDDGMSDDDWDGDRDGDDNYAW